MKSSVCFLIIFFLLSLSVFAQSPQNDNCANVIFLVVGNSCIINNYSNENASAEPVTVAPNPQCPHYAGGDVWFMVDMPSSGALRIEAETLTSATPPSVSVYAGTCGNFNEVTCYVVDKNKTVIAPDLSGQRIYIRVYSYNSSIGKPFSLCVYEPDIPANDNCENAIALTVGTTCNKANYSNAFASEESSLVAPVPDCRSYGGGDVWFRFVMPASGALRVEINNLGGATPPSVNMYSGTCGNFTELICYQLDETKTVYEPDLSGDTLYLRIFSFNSDEGNPFSLCVYEPVIPINDNCKNAIAIPVGTSCSPVNYSNAFASAEPTLIAPVPDCRNYAGGDVWFKVVMPLSGALRVETRNLSTATPPSVSIYSGVCGNFTEVICYQQDENKTVLYPDLSGETLYLRVFSFNTDEGNPFSLCVYEPVVPVNDDCENAISLTVGTSCQSLNYSNAYAGRESLAIVDDPDCRYYAGGDVWFTVMMPSTGALSMEIENLLSATPPSLSLYTGNCGSFNEIACFNQNKNPVLYEPTLAAQKLYLRIYSFNSEEGGPFTICVYDAGCIPATNDVSLSICKGESFAFGSVILSEAGLYSQTFETAKGCDSLVNLSLNIYPGYHLSDTVTVCKGGDYTFPDGAIARNIVSLVQHISRLKTKQLCDSIITTYVNVFNIDTAVTQTGLTLAAVAVADSYQWLDCDDSFNEIGGETNFSFTPFSSGNYAVRVFQNGCMDVSACYPVVILGAGEVDPGFTFKVYPNPSSGNINISLSAELNDVSIELLNMAGQILYNVNALSHDFMLETFGIPPGTYLLRITITDQSWITKQIVLR